ncbi:MAG TPA: 30S ribosomal protein S14 [Candidatus Nanoarchaeia archaeon]|nr:30S ribosomal protein S14 [Candidatus Nanoarchaeia archaeon]
MKRPVQEKIKVGKTKLQRFLKHNVPKKRAYGQRLTICIRCGGTRRHISKYGLNVCGRCFREIAKDLGFRKLR